MKKIDFMCVGVQKAGTSTLHDILQQHPDINLPNYKETHFFSDTNKYKTGIEKYFSYYFKDSNASFWGEIDPEYSYFKNCAKRIFETFGKIKIIFILRNPVDRAYSHYLMTKSRCLENFDFNTALIEEDKRLQTHNDNSHYSYIARGKYSEQIERFEHYFGEENIKVILFEDLIKETENTVDKIITFLNIPAYSFNYSIESNPASEPKNVWLQDFIYKPNKLKSTVGKLIPIKKVKDKIMFALAKKNKRVAQKQVLDIKEKQKIYKTYFKDEIETLEKKLNEDLSHWKYK